MGQEQYRTNNLVSPSNRSICISAPQFTGSMRLALLAAIANYNELALSINFIPINPDGPDTCPGLPGCPEFCPIVEMIINPAMSGGSSGFPEGGMPFGHVTIGSSVGALGVDVIEHVISHELDHTIGLRRSDFFNRSISCGTGGNEGTAGVGAVLIPGTPSTAVVGGSIMNSCFRTTETGEFTASDIVALSSVY